MNTETSGTSRPLVSIIIPSLNQGRFIEETIRSVLAQSYPHLDILVVDGGSKDGTLDILKKYDGAIRWISEPDRGHADAVNKGIQLTRGEVIGWLNSDDVYYFKDSISAAVEALDHSPDIDVVYGDAVKISEDNTILRMYLTLPYNKGRILRANYITQPTVFIRRKVANAEPFKSYISLDYEYWLRLGEKGYRFRHIPVLIAGDRQYKKRVSVSNWSTIENEVQQYKTRYDPLAKNRRLMKMIDRSMHAACRLRGILSIMQILFTRNYFDRLAFSGKIDSYASLLYRQTFKNVVEIS